MDDGLTATAFDSEPHTSMAQGVFVGLFFVALIAGGLVLYLYVFKPKSSPSKPSSPTHRGGAWKELPNKSRGTLPTPGEKGKQLATWSDCSSYCYQDSGNAYAYYNSTSQQCVCRPDVASPLINNCIMDNPAIAATGWTLISSDDSSVAPACVDSSKYVRESPRKRRGYQDLGREYPIQNATKDECTQEVAQIIASPEPLSRYGYWWPDKDGSTTGTCEIKDAGGEGSDTKDFLAGYWDNDSKADSALIYSAAGTWSADDPTKQMPQVTACKLTKDPLGRWALPSLTALRGNFAADTAAGAGVMACRQACLRNTVKSLSSDGKSCTRGALQPASLYMPNNPENHRCVCYDWYRNGAKTDLMMGNFNNWTVSAPRQGVDQSPQDASWAIDDPSYPAFLLVDTDYVKDVPADGGACNNPKDPDTLMVSSATNVLSASGGECGCDSSQGPGGGVCNVPSAVGAGTGCVNGKEPWVYAYPDHFSTGQCVCIEPSLKVTTHDKGLYTPGQLPIGVNPVFNSSRQYPDMCAGYGITTNGEGLGLFTTAQSICDVEMPKSVVGGDGGPEPYWVQAEYGQYPFLGNHGDFTTCLNWGKDPPLPAQFDNNHPNCGFCPAS